MKTNCAMTIKSLPSFLFRVDSSYTLGSGHVHRCLALASVLAKKGCDCVFVCQSLLGNCVDLIQNNGFIVIIIDSIETKYFDENNLNNSISSNSRRNEFCKYDAKITLEAIGDRKFDWLVIDHYALDECWEKKLRQKVKKILVIDDLANKNHDCDILLDQNLVENYKERYTSRVPLKSTLLLGPEYNLLKQDYPNLRHLASIRTKPIKRVLINFGGGDTLSLIKLTIEALSDLNKKNIILDLVVPKIQKKEIIDIISKKTLKKINFHHNINSLAKLMLLADLAIGACGVSSWERCSLNLPSLFVSIADNQVPIAKQLQNLGVGLWLGNSSEITKKKMLKALKDTFANNYLENWSSNCKNIVDGKGSFRVASILLLENIPHLNIRNGSVNDYKILHTLDINNRQENNLSGFENLKTDLSIKLYNYCLRDPDRNRYYITETKEGATLSTIKFYKNDFTWSASYCFLIANIDQNLKTKILSLMISKFRQDVDGYIKFGKFKDVNEISSRSTNFNNSILKQNSQDLSLSICSDSNSWFNQYIATIIESCSNKGFSCTWVHDHCQLIGGDICFYLSYGKIVDSERLKLFKNNLVIHASDLPRGKGWSPASWQILEGAEKIPLTMIEALPNVDSGPIYEQHFVEIEKSDLVTDWRFKLSIVICSMVNSFVENYPASKKTAYNQSGESTFYRKRQPVDSELDVKKEINKQFNLLRIVDNVKYPAYFIYRGKKFFIKIEKSD